MDISRNQINEAMKHFLAQGGSINRYEQTFGEPVLGNDIWLTEDTLEQVETRESDLLI